MALTHVYFWDEKIGYRPIELDEACNKNEGTVSAKSGVFICGLCHEGVALTRKGKRDRYFKHGKDSSDKECEERIRGDSDKNVKLGEELVSPELYLSIKENMVLSKLRFFFPGEAKFQCDKIIICIGESKEPKKIYSFNERIREGVNYLDVGEIEEGNYYLQYSGYSQDLIKYWGRSISGIDLKGTIWEFPSGKVLKKGSTVIVGNQYILLLGRNRKNKIYGIRCIEINKVDKFSDEEYILRKVRATEFSKEAAKFFLEYGLFLRPKAIVMELFWPPSIESENMICHNRKHSYFYTEYNLKKNEIELLGNNSIGKKEIEIIDLMKGSLVDVPTYNSSILVSLKNKVTTWWSQITSSYDFHDGWMVPRPSIDIIDKDKKVWMFGSSDTLPKEGLLIFTAPYDGEIVRYQNEMVQEIRVIEAGNHVAIDKIYYGCKLVVYQGRDHIGTLKFFKRENPCSKIDDISLYAHLVAYKDDLFSVPHSMRNIAKNFLDYPYTYRWICKSIRKNKISRKAYNYLLMVISDMEC